MKYMLLIYTDEKAWAEGEREQCMVDSTRLAHELADRGQFVSASPLHPVAMATSLRIREGKRLITDGPFAETHEQLGGYYIIDVPDLDAALDVAARIPGARKGSVEIRPVHILDDLPESSGVPLADAASS